MLIQEFAERTGFFPTAAMYEIIEKRYTEFDGNKDAFCAAYKANKDGIAESIQREASMAEIKAQQEHKAEVGSKDKEIEGLKKQIERLKEDLERAAGWKEYEVSKMSQERFDKLALMSDTETMTDDEAAKFIEQEFGFSASRVTIFREIPTYQASEIGGGCKRIRKAGTVSRPPVYNATDWNYIRFNCVNWQYEIVNGELYQYCD